MEVRAINGFQGQKSFITLRNLANAYDKLKRTDRPTLPWMKPC
jgi:hypothetical protein